MDTIEQTLAVATEHHRAGRTTEAESLYREVLAASPGHPDALHLLGVIGLQSGRPAEAVDLIGRAVAGDPTSPLLHANLGHALHATGQSRDAALSFARALTLLTNEGEGWGNVSALAGLIRRYDDETRRAAAAEVDAAYTMGDVMRRHSLLFLLDGDVAHYEALTDAVLEDPMRFTVPSIHYAFWGMAMQLFQGAARRGDTGAFQSGNLTDYYRLMVDETALRYHLRRRMKRATPRDAVKRIALITNQMLGAGHQPTADAFDFARRLQDEFGREVVIINPNAMAITGENGFVPEYSYNITEEYEGEQVIAAFGARVRMMSFPQKRFDEEKVNAIVDYVDGFDPDVIVAFGGSNVVADLFSGARPVICLPTSSGLPLSMARLVLGYGETDTVAGWPADMAERFRPFSFGWTLPPTGPERSRADFGLPEAGPLFLVVGNRLDQEAGPEFLAMADSLLDRLPEARIAVAGGVEALPQRIAALRNADRVHALGDVEDVRALHRHATAYLNPRRQGGGGSAAFALADGVPVVTVAAGDVATVAGPAFTVADDAAYLERAITLAGDAAFRDRQSAEARARFAEAGDRRASVERLLAYALEAQTA
ncbi:glycosyltransferase [Azospirillum brasilense]|uniref:tetratricopeptide repeat protein n=1 Tax=Azospirillum brasilense TaxID=192 RepID=UPI00190C4AF7|nr:tetratricopeptide repeat protein [Azospirillum brasilense]MBK3734521.1 glycosyltransferase [Azospirillum brasilense]